MPAQEKTSPYRAPAPDEEAERDAAEVAAFALGLKKMRRRANVHVTSGAVLGIGAFALVLVLLFGHFLHREPADATQAEPRCYTTYQILVNADGTKTHRKSHRVCPGVGFETKIEPIPPPPPT